MIIFMNLRVSSGLYSSTVIPCARRLAVAASKAQGTGASVESDFPGLSSVVKEFGRTRRRAEVVWSGMLRRTLVRLAARRPNREALSLYREILRHCRRFHWCNDKGEPWNKLLKDSARKEFEQARDEPVGLRASSKSQATTLAPDAQDPLLVARMLVVGRQCLDDTMRKARHDQCCFAALSFWKSQFLRPSST